MAALIEEARARREEAARLRMESVSLRLAVRQSLRTGRERLAAAEGARFRFHGVLDAPQSSPWSELGWRLPDGELERVLVPVD